MTHLTLARSLFFAALLSAALPCQGREPLGQPHSLWTPDTGRLSLSPEFSWDYSTQDFMPQWSKLGLTGQYSWSPKLSTSIGLFGLKSNDHATSTQSWIGLTYFPDWASKTIQPYLKSELGSEGSHLILGSRISTGSLNDLGVSELKWGAGLEATQSAVFPLWRLGLVMRSKNSSPIELEAGTHGRRSSVWLYSDLKLVLGEDSQFSVGASRLIIGPFAEWTFGARLSFQWTIAHPDSAPPNPSRVAKKHPSLKTQVKRVDSGTHLVEIPKGSEAGVWVGQYFTLSQDEQEIASGEVIAVRPDSAVIQITEYFIKKEIQEGFIAQALLSSQ